MEELGVIASVIAAVGSVAGILLARRQSRHRQLVEIVDLLNELRHVTEYGGWIRGPKNKLRVRLGSMNLPITRALLDAPLRRAT